MIKIPTMKLPTWRTRSNRCSGRVADVGCTGRLFSYRRVPQSPMRLSVLRLGGTSFDVSVARNASVEDLKRAVEDIFNGKNGGEQLNVSWSHVWGYFSLSYMNDILIDKKTKLKVFGIKDGDTLKFIRNRP